MELNRLEEILKLAWCRETSFTPERWSPENPAFGQCVPTALIVNDYLGGKIVWAEATYPDGTKESHYFNEVDGKQLDLTRCQFPEGTAIPIGIDRKKNFPTTRDYLLSSSAVKMRYDLLKSLVDSLAK